MAAGDGKEEALSPTRAVYLYELLHRLRSEHRIKRCAGSV